MIDQKTYNKDKQWWNRHQYHVDEQSNQGFSPRFLIKKVSSLNCINLKLHFLKRQHYFPCKWYNNNMFLIFRIWIHNKFYKLKITRVNKIKNVTQCLVKINKFINYNWPSLYEHSLLFQVQFQLFQVFSLLFVVCLKSLIWWKKRNKCAI